MIDISLLGAFASTTQQQYQTPTVQRVIHAVPRADIDLEFPHPIAAVATVTEMAVMEACHTTNDGNLCTPVTQLLKPMQVGVPAPHGRQVVLHIKHGKVRL